MSLKEAASRGGEYAPAESALSYAQFSDILLNQRLVADRRELQKNPTTGLAGYDFCKWAYKEFGVAYLRGMLRNWTICATRKQLNTLIKLVNQRHRHPKY